MGRVIFVMFSVMVLSIASVSTTGAGDKIVRLDALIEEALENNPEIFSAKKKREVYAERVPQAGALEDPMLGLGIVNLPTNLSFT
jgi:outer membrane protein TolC